MKLIPKHQEGYFVNYLRRVKRRMDNLLLARGTAFKKANPEQAKQYTSNTPEKEYVVNRTADNTPNYNSRRGGITLNEINRKEQEALKKRREEEKALRIKRQKEDEEYFRTHATSPLAIGAFGKGAEDYIPKAFNKAIEYGIGKPFNWLLEQSFKHPPIPTTSQSSFLDTYRLSDLEAKLAALGFSENVLSWTTPSGIAGHIFPGFIEDVRGSEWGNAVLNALDLYATPKMYKGAGKAVKFGTSPIHGEWTRFGNNEYRLNFKKPKSEPQPIAYEGENGIQIIPANDMKTYGTFIPGLGELNDVIENAIEKRELPQGMAKNGWTMDKHGIVTNGKGSFMAYINGRWTDLKNLLKGNKPTNPKYVKITEGLKNGTIGYEELKALVGAKDAKYVFGKTPLNVLIKNGDELFLAIMEKASEGLKGKRGANIKINKAIEERLARTPAGMVKTFRNLPISTESVKLLPKEFVLRYIPEEYIEAYNRGEYIPKNIPTGDYVKYVADNTGINWADDAPGSMLSGMPDKLKTITVGTDKVNPFLKRYYNNIPDVIKFQDLLIAKGDLVRQPNGKWMGKYANGKYYELRYPEEYVKVKWAREVKGYEDIELPVAVGLNDGFLIHGTRNKDISYLTNPNEYVGGKGLWTVVRNHRPYAANAIRWYKGNGYSVPFYRSPGLELPSFEWYGTSYDLLDHLNSPRFTNKVMRPRSVLDANSPSAGLIDEYDWGPSAPMPKSSWNTLDFEKGAGPLANNSEQNNQNDFINYNYA